MTNYQKINIDGNEYYIIDSIQDLRAEDSFIHRKNKLAMFNGQGEARKYVGSYKGDKGEGLSQFFEYDKWGKGKIDGKRVYTPIQEKCLFSKSNLLKYLYDARVEYKQQEQIYNFDISNNYDEYINSINELDNEINYFSIFDVSDFVESGKYRGYIKSKSKVWSLLRKILLPKISYLSILKLIPVNNSNSTPFFYFRILLDYNFRSIIHPKIGEKIEEVTKKDNTQVVLKRTKAREGQQKYRKGVIEYMPQCPFTLISDERLLIASHIKPYKACIDDNNMIEASDYLNGLALSPTYDKLFDQGYITFTDDGNLICGTLLSPYTWDKLNINPNLKKKFRIFPENREKYLDYHRKYVFQDNFEELK